MKKTTKLIASALIGLQLGTSLLAAPAIAAEGFGSSIYSSPSSRYQGYNQPAAALPAYGAQIDTYFTDSMGNILMYVNVVGEVYKPGQQIVRQDADLSTLLSLVGGPKDDANLEKVRLLRYKPDENGKQTYEIDLENYFETGDRSQFVELKPSDTLVIPEDKGLDSNLAFRIIGLALSVATLAVAAGR